MKEIAWVAHAFPSLATVFHRRELFENANASRTTSRSGKFVAVEHRDQHTRRVRYPDFN